VPGEHGFPDAVGPVNEDVVGAVPAEGRVEGSREGLDLRIAVEQPIRDILTFENLRVGYHVQA